MQMVQELQAKGIGQRQPRAATQGGHIFQGGRGNAYAAVGNKIQGAKFMMHNQQYSNQDGSQASGYVGQINGSPKFSNKNKYFSNQPLMNMKFPTTSHGNRSQTNHHGANYMQNVLGNIQKHI